MKRRNLKVNTQKTVEMAKVAIEGKECKAIVFDHHKRLCFKEVNNTPGKNVIGLSLGVFSKEPFKYDCIKRPLATKFTKNDSRKLSFAIKMVELTETKAETIESIESEIAKTTPTETEMTVEPDTIKTVETVAIDIDSDLKKEKACYDHAVKCANKIITAIESLETSGIPKEYISSRYPDIRSDILSGAATLSVKWSDLNTAVYKKSSIEERIRDLQQQLAEADYQVYLAKESYIIAMRNQTSHLEDLDNIMAMVEEDKTELKRLNRIRELEEELATLKGESKFSNSDAPSHPEEQPEPTVTKKQPIELDVAVASEAQEREIRYLASHFYEVRRGRENPNPTIYRKVAELSRKLELPKKEFCKKILNISTATYNERHREFMYSLGIDLYGEEGLKPIAGRDIVDEIKRWCNIHLIKVEGEVELLNTDVYDAFCKETGADVCKDAFYRAVKKGGGYITVSHTRDKKCLTYYKGYQLV